jgi:hypothetical protein
MDYNNNAEVKGYIDISKLIFANKLGIDLYMKESIWQNVYLQDNWSLSIGAY